MDAPRRRPGLRVEVGINLVLLTVVVAALNLGIFLIVGQRDRLHAGLPLAEQSAHLVAAQLALGGTGSYATTLAEAQKAGLGELSLFAPSGRLIAGVSTAAPDELGAVLSTRRPESRMVDGEVQVLQPVGGPGRPNAVLLLRSPDIDGSSSLWTIALLHVSLSALAVLLFGAILFQRSLLVPMERLRQAAAAIARGETGAEISEDAPAELAELAASLNQLSAALARYQERTRSQLTHLEATNAELRTAQDALVQTEKLASVGRLAAGLAHELGNPLTAVRGYLALLKMEAPGNTETAEVLARCQTDVERMHGILRDLLDFSRPGGGIFTRVSLHHLLEEAARSVRHQPAFRSIRLQVEAPVDVHFSADPNRMHQVILNLLLNAAEAGSTRIDLTGDVKDGELLLRCIDNGHGIHAEQLPRLFEPFYTTRPPGAGTGLGLAVVQQVIRQHQGRIQVESQPERGSTFIITLPLAPGPPLSGG